MKPVSCARPSRVKRGWTIPNQWSFESEKNIELNAMMTPESNYKKNIVKHSETILGTSFVRFHVRILGLHTYLAWWWPSLYVACHKSLWNYCWALSWEMVGIGNNNTFFWGGELAGSVAKKHKDTHLGWCHVNIMLPLSHCWLTSCRTGNGYKTCSFCPQ